MRNPTMSGIARPPAVSAMSRSVSGRWLVNDVPNSVRLNTDSSSPRARRARMSRSLPATQSGQTDSRSAGVFDRKSAGS